MNFFTKHGTTKIVHKNGRTVYSLEISPNKINHENKGKFNYLQKSFQRFPSCKDYRRYFGVILCGLAIWGIFWFILDDAFAPNGYLFRMAFIVIIGYISGHTLQRYTTLPPLVTMTLVGALYRNLGSDNFLEHPVANAIDIHLRKVYPVIILTRGPLGWNWDYMRRNALRVFSLATVPWLVECGCVAIFSHIILYFPWVWGLHLGTILSSVSPAVVLPAAMSFHAQGLGTKNEIANLVANAGGLDTTFSEAVFGVVNSVIFYPATTEYKITKAVLAVFVAIVLGVAWGVLVDYIPAQNDKSAAAVRSIIMLSSGVLLAYAVGYSGWGGMAGVAVMVCAGTAATRWSRRGWPLNTNPVGEVFRVLWLIFEPMLFTLSGYHLNFSLMDAREWGLAVACVMIALLFRVITAFLLAWISKLTVKESIFIAITWTPKAIVEACLVRAAADSLWTDGSTTEEDIRISKLHSNIIVMSIILTSALGSALTTLSGPFLLSQKSRVTPEEHSKSSAENRSNADISVHCTDVIF